MAILVHITDEKNSAAILRSGIRLPRKNKAIYFMPMLQSHFVSHQWIRELRRDGAKVLVGVYFRLPSKEQVWAGRYNHEHKPMTLGQVIREINSIADPLGYEVFIDRPITVSEIQKIRHLPQGIGWRYMPHAHGKPLCACPVCMPAGMFKSRLLRERLEPATRLLSLDAVKAKLQVATDADDITDLLWALRQKRRQIDPAFLEPIMASKEATNREDVALTLPYIRHPDSKRMLQLLANDKDPDVSKAAKEGLGKV